MNIYIHDRVQPCGVDVVTHRNFNTIEVRTVTLMATSISYLYISSNLDNKLYGSLHLGETQLTLFRVATPSISEACEKIL